jgi:hypothetical protein
LNLQEAIALGKSRSDCEPKNIDTLVRIVNETETIPGDIVECGSYRCGATIAMAAANPDKWVFAFDVFGGLPYGESQAGFDNFAKNNINEILEAIRPFENIILIRGRHEETVPDCKLKSISLLFMDSDFYESHAVCLSHFWPLLSSGGVIVFHDWSFPGVQKAVAEFIPADACQFIGTLADSPNMGCIVKK